MFYMISQFIKRVLFLKKTSWAERHFILVLLAATLFAMTLSLVIGMQQSVWFDEAYSVMLAKQPIDEILRLTAIDTHPPLYYFLLKGWAAIFGWGELALRSLSILAFGGSLVVGGLLAKRLFGVRAALFALPFLVLAPFLLRYGFEIRMYTIASLIGISATYILVRALQAKSNRVRWVLYGLYAVLVAIGVYTLYYLALLWIAHAVWLLWISLAERKPIRTWYWVPAFAASVVLFMPWLPTFLSQLNNGALTPVVQQLALIQLVEIVTFNFLYEQAWQVSVTASLVVMYVVGALAYFTIKAFKNASMEQRKHLVLMAMYVTVPILLLMLITLRKPMYVERYLAHVIIGGVLFVGVAIAIAIGKSRSRHMWVAAGLLLAVMAIGTTHLVQRGNYNFQRSQQPSAKQVASYVERSCESNTAIVAEDPYYAIELSYYLPNCQIYFFSETAELSGGYAMLSNSPLHLYYPIETVGTAKRLFYVYDGDLTVQLSPRFKTVSERAFDAVNVREFSAE
jgi:mannosyltransferase